MRTIRLSFRHEARNPNAAKRTKEATAIRLPFRHEARNSNAAKRFDSSLNSKPLKREQYYTNNLW
jgi:hypothetical protein